MAHDSDTYRDTPCDSHSLLQCLAALRQELNATQQELATIRAERDYFHLIADSTYDWEYWLAPDGSLRYVSPACERITGYRPDEFCADAGLLDHIVHPDDRERLQCHLSAEQHHQPSYALEFRIITRNGEQRWIGHVCQPIYSAAGVWVGQRASNRDITAQKQTEAALQESEARYRAMFERNRAVKLLIDPTTGAIVDANPAASVFYGYTLEQLRTMKITDLNMLSTAEVHAKMQRARTEQCPYFHFQHRLASGEVRDVEVHSSPLTVGGQHLLFSIIHDITERMRAEEALQRQRQFLRQIIDSNPAIICARDRDGRFTLVNQTLIDVYGTTRENLLGQTDADMNLDANEVAQLNQEDQQVLATGTELIIPERRITDASGRTRYISIVKRPLFTAGDTADQVLLVATDITERKLAELQIRRVNASLLQGNAQLQQRNQEVMLLNQMGDMLQGCLGLDDAYEVIAVCAEKLFAGQSGALYLRHNNTTCFEAVASWGDPPPAEPTLEQQQCHALRTQQVALFFRANGGCCAHFTDGATVAALCVPLVVGGEMLGTLHLRTRALVDHEARQRWKQLADSAARQISLALHNLALRERLRQQAIHDPLTGLYNRRYLDATLPREVQRAVRQEQPVGVIMLDIDHFKRFNDTYGHDAGDALLRAVGSFLQSHTRGADIACRYGGEEFTLVLPGASREATRQRAEELRAGVQTLVVEYNGYTLEQITISLGISSFPDQGQTADALIHAADQALYQAKRDGRDRVVMAGSEPSPSRWQP